MVWIRIITCDNLDEFFWKVFELEKNRQHNEQLQTTLNMNDSEQEPEVNNKGFEALMKAKGYKVKSKETKKTCCERFNIRKIKRGKHYWYNLQDIEKIPAKA
jgi:hypothetical protein